MRYETDTVAVQQCGFGHTFLEWTNQREHTERISCTDGWTVYALFYCTTTTWITTEDKV